jgi:protein TonB
MNCENVANVLDDGMQGRLSATERCELDRHLAGCADCASAWRAHAALLAQHIPPLPAALVDRALAQLGAAAPAAPARPRRSLARLIAVPAILALGGAFAALGLFTPTTNVTDPEPAPPEASAGGGALADTPRRPAGLDDPLIEIPAAAPAARASAVRFPDGDSFVLLREPPVYPVVALREGAEASVHLSYTIATDGTVTDVTVVESTDERFNASASLAVERWKYMPRVVGGERAAVSGVHTVIRYQMAPPAGEEVNPDEQPPQDRPLEELLARAPLANVLARAWDCAAVRNLLCAHQVLDEITATYDLTPDQRRTITSFYGYLYTQYGDFERAIDAYRDAGETVTLMHLYFVRQQYQQALDTAVGYLADLRETRGRSDPAIEAFVAKLEQLGITASTGPIF